MWLLLMKHILGGSFKAAFRVLFSPFKGENPLGKSVSGKVGPARPHMSGQTVERGRPEHFLKSSDW